MKTKKSAGQTTTKIAKPEKAKATKPAKIASDKEAKAAKAEAKKLSQIAAAVAVLAKAGEPMNCKAMVEAMTAQGLWTSPGGATPDATLYASILRDINTNDYLPNYRGSLARMRDHDAGYGPRDNYPVQRDRSSGVRPAQLITTVAKSG